MTSLCVSFTIYQHCHGHIEGDVTPTSLRYQNVHWAGTGHIKATTTPKVHQLDTAIQTEVILKNWPQEEITPQNSLDTGKSLPKANARKSGNNQSLRQNKETLIVGESTVKHIDDWQLNKRMRSTVSLRSIPSATTKGLIHHVKGCLEDTSSDFIILHHGTNDLNGDSTSEEIAY